MQIAILGTGTVGGALGVRWSTAGYSVTFGSRDPQGDKAQALLESAGDNTSAASIADAANNADVVLLATPWPAAEETLNGAGDLTGKVLIDCTNPINATFTGLDLGFEESAAERIATWAPGARVVKAFNTVSAAVMSNTMFDETPAAMFYCGDDQDAKQTVHQLAESIGMEPIDSGDLSHARYLEPLAMLYIKLAIQHRWGGDCAIGVMRRPRT